MGQTSSPLRLDLLSDRASEEEGGFSSWISQPQKIPFISEVLGLSYQCSLNKVNCKITDLRCGKNKMLTSKKKLKITSNPTAMR